MSATAFPTREAGTRDRVTEQRTFDEMYGSTYAAVYRASYLVAADRAVAEEAAQEAFARALERWERLRNEPWVVGWVLKTAMNVARRAMRRVPRAEPAAEVEASSGDPDAAIDLRNAIRRLSRRQQACVVLHYFADMPVADVAAALGMNSGTVKVHLSRARRHLGAHLKEEDPVD